MTLTEPRFIQLPLVHAILESRTNKIATDALVDSGATTTFVPREIAETIGLTDEKPVAASEATGAGGRFATDIFKLKRLVLVKNISSFAQFVEVNVYVTKDEGQIPYVILGRDHVFPRFDITFHENRRKFTFHRL